MTNTIAITADMTARQAWDAIDQAYDSGAEVTIECDTTVADVRPGDWIITEHRQILIRGHTPQLRAGPGAPRLRPDFETVVYPIRREERSELGSTRCLVLAGA